MKVFIYLSIIIQGWPQSSSQAACDSPTSLVRLAHDTLIMFGFENKIFCFIKAVSIVSVRCSSVKTERYFDLMNFSVEHMALADCSLLKFGSESWSS
jgi:hypothetical protein